MRLAAALAVAAAALAATGLLLPPCCSEVLKLRLLRFAVAACVGAALGLAGALVQSATGNVLAEPGLLGLSTTALLTASLMILWAPWSLYHPELVSLAAFAGALAGYAMTVTLAEAAGSGPAALLLAGIAVTAATSGLAELTSYLIHSLTGVHFMVMLLGTFAYVGVRDLMVISAALLAALPVAMIMCRPLNAIAYGDDYARGSGYNPKLVRIVSSLTASMLVGFSVAACGLIGFVGLVSPNAARIIAGRWDNTVVLPLSALVGAVVTCAADTVGRIVGASLGVGELPVGVLTAMLGGPFFAYLLARRGTEG